MLSVMWGRYFVGGALAAAKTQMPVCLAFGAALYFVGVLLPQPVALGMLFALPVLSAACLRKGLTVQACCDEFSSAGALRKAVGKLAPSLLCVAVCALVFGLIGQIALTAPAEQGVEHVVPPMGIAAGGFISCLLAFGIRAKVTFDMVYRGVFAVASVGLFLLPFLGENYSVVFNLFVICAYYLMEIYYFYFAVEIVQTYKIRVYAAFGLSHGVLCAMTLLGIFLSVSVFSESQYGTVQLALIAFVSAYLLGMGLLIGVRRRAISGARRGSRGGSDIPASSNLPAAFSEEHAFSRREAEVFSFLVAGRTGTFIAEAIGLSPSTVKGHIQNIYRKCDVHNRQELIDAYERWQDVR